MTTTATQQTKLPDWLTKEEAATILVCSGRAIERRAEKKQIATKKQERQGTRPATLFAGEDVERIRGEMQLSSRGPSELVQTAEPSHNALATIATIVQSLRPDSAAAAPPRRKCWLTLEEASNDSGLSQRFLQRLARSHKITAVRDGREWKIASAALDAWQPVESTSKHHPKHR